MSLKNEIQVLEASSGHSHITWKIHNSGCNVELKVIDLSKIILEHLRFHTTQKRPVHTAISLFPFLQQ